jgi:hypothetical protein
LPYQKIQSNHYGNSYLIQNSQQSSKFGSEGYNTGSYNQYGSGLQYNDQSYVNSGYNQYAKNQENDYGAKSNFSTSGAGKYSIFYLVFKTEPLLLVPQAPTLTNLKGSLIQALPTFMATHKGIQV